MSSFEVVMNLRTYVYTGSRPDFEATLKDPQQTDPVDKNLYKWVIYDSATGGTEVTEVYAAGTYWVCAEPADGTTSYTGQSKRCEFVISPKSISDVKISDFANQPFKNAAYTADDFDFTGKLTFASPELTLALTTDYTVAFSDATNAGEATITFTGTGNYTGTTTTTFNITPKESWEGVTVTITNPEYNGNAATPEVTIVDNSFTSGVYRLQATDFIAESTNVDAGPATLTITGAGNYQGAPAVTNDFTITRRNFASTDIVGTFTNSFTYDGTAKKPEIVVVDNGITINGEHPTLTEGTDYTVAYLEDYNDKDNEGDLINVGDKYIYIKAASNGNYRYGKTDTRIASDYKYTINKADVHITADSKNYGYGASCILSYSDDKPGKGDDIQGTVTLTVKKDGTTYDDLTNLDEGEYDIEVSMTEEDKALNTNYNIILVNGTLRITKGDILAKVVIDGEVNEDGVVTFPYRTDLSGNSKFSIKDGYGLAVDGISPTYKVTKQGSDEPIADYSKLGVGTYTVSATATLANYNVLVSSADFTITPKNITDNDIKIATLGSKVYTGSKVEAPSTTGKITWEDDSDPANILETLEEEADYTVSADSYDNNTVAGGGKIKITANANGNYTGEREVEFAITKAPLVIKAIPATYTYGTKTDGYNFEAEVVKDATNPGLLGNDELTDLTADGILKAEIDQTVVKLATASVGDYANGLKPVRFVAANYDIDFQPATLTIDWGKIVLTVDDETHVYGDNTCNGILILKENDEDNEKLNDLVKDGGWKTLVDVSNVTFTLSDPEENGKYEYDGNYTITATGTPTSTNYTVTIDGTGKFIVEKAKITLYANDQEINWNDELTTNDEPNTEISTETVAIAEGEMKYSEALTEVINAIVVESTNVGDNKISLEATNNSNYTIIVNKDADGNEKFGNLKVIGADVLALDDSRDDNFTKISEYNGQTKGVTIKFNRDQEIASSTRSWTKGQWNSLVLPFEISVATLSSKFGYAIFNVADPDNTKEGNVQFMIEMGLNNDGKIPANTPLLVKSNQDLADGTTIDFGTQTIVAPETAQFGEEINSTNYKFMGTYEKLTVTKDFMANDYYFWTGSTSKPSRIVSGSPNAWNIVPFACYVDQTGTSASARALDLTFTYQDLDGTTTSVRGISTDNNGNESVNNGWYNLNGVKMQNVPTTKGVYIMNGKKVVVK